MTKETNKPVIVLFDGVCNLCNGTVQFIIRHDREAKFRFASLQSEAGKEIMRRFNLDTEALHSVLVVEGDKLYERSDAALKIASRLDGAWSSLTAFRFVPRFIRDAMYNLIAGNRYAVFGKRDECMIPTPELKSRFL